MSQRTFLILGDIHFGIFADHRDFITQAMNKNAVISNSPPMIEGIIKIAEETSSTYDGILVPGDLTSIGAPSEFAECEAVINSIARRLKIKKERVYLTFGNHDVDWEVSKLADGKAPSSPDPLYRKVAAITGPALLSINRPNVEGPIVGSGLWHEDGVEIIVLNTGFECSHDQAVRNGNIGHAQLEWLKTLPARQADKLRIIMIHHHPMNLPYPSPITDTSTLAEGAELLVEIDRLDIDFVLHGHRHHPILHTFLKPGWRKAVTFLCAGSVGVGASHRLGGDIPNTFHIVCFDGRSAEGAAIGKVLTYGFRAGTGWTPVEYSKEVPIDWTQHFGACATQDQAKQCLATLLDPILKEQPIMFKVPEFDSLPLELRSCPVSQINSIVKDLLTQHGYSMCGKFPEAVVSLK